ncbi:MAG: hypothetical protein HRU18_18505 [Pseudoalteromonas sp.]|uniref:hypothetical protein n=1 Tax=Pseudoalteromonas sp. TaxID=53249 RepID=UPI001D563F44|nr:hypothetical protein [Pseudoalteromonas sp.]NRA80197.1 hypothetical protein [Pseudoalteromonas sp.]
MANPFTKKSIDFDVYERANPEAAIDWGKQAKTISDAFQGVADERAKKKAAIEKSFNDQQAELNKLGEYDNPTAQEIVMNAGQDGAQKLMDIKNLVKRGIIKPSEATMFQQNQLNGFNLLKQNMGNFDKTFQEYTKRLQDGTGAPGEEWLAKQLEGFASLNGKSVQTDPLTGKVSMLSLDENGKPIDGESMSLQRLTLLMKQKIDNFDVGEAVVGIKDEVGTITTSLVNSKYGPNAVITEEERSRLETEFFTSEKGKTFLEQKAQSLIASPFDQQSMMMNAKLTTENGTQYQIGSQEDYDEWMAANDNDEKNNPFLVMEFDKDNQYKPRFNEFQNEKAMDYAKAQITGSLDYKKTQQVKSLAQKQQDTPATAGRKKEQQTNFGYLQSINKVLDGDQGMFNAAVKDLAAQWNKANPDNQLVLKEPVDRSSDEKFILVKYQNGTTQKIPKFQLDADENYVLDKNGEKIPVDKKTQAEALTSYITPITGSSYSQVYDEFVKSEGGFEDLGFADQTVSYTAPIQTIDAKTNIGGTPVDVDGTTLSDKLISISDKGGKDENKGAAMEAELRKTLQKNLSGITDSYDIKFKDLVNWSDTNEMIVTIDGVEEKITFNTSTAEGVAKLTGKLDEILTARREKYNKEQQGGGNKDKNTKKKTPLSKK